MLADALKAAPIENGSWDCGDFPTRALSCKARCPSGLSLPNNSQRKISLKGCRSISPTIEFLGFNGEPLDCMRPKDRCDNAIRALNVGSNGSWSGLSGDRKRRDTNYHYGPDRNQRFHWEYRLTCNDGRRIAKYRCDKGGNISQQAGYLISMCEYPCHVGDVDELFPLGAGHWNCYSTGNGAKRRCKADCDWNGARKVSFDLECGRFGWQKDPDRNQGKKLDYCQAAPVNDE